MGRCLIVANQTLGGAALEREVRDRIERGDLAFHVLVPLVEPGHEVTSWVPADPMFGFPPPLPTDVREDLAARARERCEQRLAAMVDKVTALGGRADGELGDADPLRAVDLVLRRESFDEIIVSTLPAGLSRWVRMDLPSRVDRLTDIPLTVVEADQ